ncbi:hypothetical protein [Deinococcus sp. QL22]|uniref:hypothetical protein n=1 Tax=Deinococcus sp. QL22 TaxID=2939437 RepID=UPI002017228C|nr:hypothetical protein [Deinococcus sp. QL22]UQN08766.1 hypothetical protein M1R55_21870 [Deinococcus sp. QL22]
MDLFLPENQIGQLPSRVTVHTSGGERLGSGAFVPALWGVMLRVDAWPTLVGGGCWLLARVPEGVGMVDVPSVRRRGHAPPVPQAMRADQVWE